MLKTNYKEELLKCDYVVADLTYANLNMGGD